MEGERTHWVDIAKGLLILLVVWGHLDFCANAYAGTSAFAYKGLTNFAFLPFYMPAFFVLSGMCSNFHLPAHLFLYRNFKSLIVPSVLMGCFASHWLRLFLEDGLSWKNFLAVNYYSILMTAGQWFLSALFVAKCLYYFLSRSIQSELKKLKMFLLSIMLLMIGSVMYNRGVLNIWCYQHALMAFPFLVIGRWLHDNSHIVKSSIVLFIGGGGILYSYLFGYPFINSTPHITWHSSLLFLALSLSGSLLIFNLSMVIARNRFLEYIGRHTLTIYLLHYSIMIFFLKGSVLLGVDEWPLLIRVITGVLIVIITTIVCLLLDTIIDRHFGFLKGKF